VPGLDEPHLAAWRALLHAHAAALGRIERDLARAGPELVPLTWYDVLIELLEAPDHRLRQRDLARSVVLTRSGISRLIDRLEAAGLVAREPDPADRRGTLIALTDAGRELIDRLTVAHLDNEREILGALTETEQRRLAELLRKLQLGLPPR
jgi:DNA-binding MarR family transcriptional regulator